MINDLHSKSLKELRVLYPGIKSTSKVGFIEQVVKADIIEQLDKEVESSYDPAPTELQGILNVITPSEGLGDTIEKVLDSPILKPITKAIKSAMFKDGDDCGCKERKLKLNKLFKYKFKPRCFTEDEYKQWGKFRTALEAKSTLRIENDEIKYVCTIFSSIMNRQYYEPCRNCSPKPLIYMIDNLNTIYDSYK